MKREAVYEAEIVLLLSPSAATTALTVTTEWNLLSAGTAHGFGVFDLIHDKVIMS